MIVRGLYRALSRERSSTSASHPVPTDPGCWDAEVACHGGSLLQSWRWGTFKARHGWEVERVRVEAGGKTALAQILFRRYGPFSLAYLPRGPVLPLDEAVAHTVFTAIDTACARHRAVAIIVEPDRPLPLGGDSRSHGLVRGPRPFQPSRTVKVPLLDDAALLAQMRRDTRANIRRAEREGVVVERATPTPASATRFYTLLQETATRNAFEVHTADYYTDLLCHFGDDALVSFVRVGDEDAVGLIAVRQGAEAVYLYGGSSAAHRVRGAAALLQLDAMRWARAGGCRSYDLWGLPAVDPPAGDLARGQVARTQGDRWDGLYQFKTGFGGEIVAYPPLLERRYHPWLWWVARRAFPRYRTVSCP